MKDCRIFGIDPGSQIVGYGVIDVQGQDPSYLASGVIRAGKKGEEIQNRLHRVSLELDRLLQEFRPDLVVLETAFFGKSVSSALRLGESRGVALVCAARAGVKVVQYSPAVVKKAVVGYGRADKHQVASMVQALLELPAAPSPLDASDALALALCQCHRMGDNPLQNRAFPGEIS